MGELSGRSFLVTGANTGIGLATATALAARGGTVTVTARSAEKGAAAVAAIVSQTGSEQVRFLQLDLSDLAAVRAAAATFVATGEPLDVLINNAGVAGQRGLTRDGFELMFGVNHLGHFAFTLGLLDCLTASAGRSGLGARIVTVASDAHFQAKGVDFDQVRRRTRAITGMPEYAVSKLSNVLFSQELARRLDGTGVTSYVLHPGVVASDIWRRVPWPARRLVTRRMLTVEQGARTSLYCAAEPGLAAVSGRYYDNCSERQPSPVATAELAGQLWAHSEAWTRG
jgi:NAD(P)-dependent dehydrogenase (short-subunit alcohol dehydrogenase family)